MNKDAEVGKEEEMARGQEAPVRWGEEKNILDGALQGPYPGSWDRKEYNGAATWQMVVIPTSAVQGVAGRGRK